MRKETSEERSTRVWNWMNEVSKINKKYGIEVTRIDWEIKDLLIAFNENDIRILEDEFNEILKKKGDEGIGR